MKTDQQRERSLPTVCVLFSQVVLFNYWNGAEGCGSMCHESYQCSAPFILCQARSAAQEAV